jgi:two-component system chemotaxis sensor kinase CheA
MAVPPPAPSLVLDASPAADAHATAVADSAIRVDVGLLDKLMALVGELVLTRNQILQFSPPQENTAFLATRQKLNLLTTELQTGVMKTRMQPIGNVWTKFPRLVRDLAVACGKEVRLDMDGRDTELDKTIIEAIRDPLTHLVRNSIDHGIETPNVRLARGKPASGRLHLRAFHEGGKVVIEIADDGAGIDSQRVRDKAIKLGLVTVDEAARMGERELVNLIFRPGFSTADKVTQFSGRGVGMDVVRTNIEKIGGTVDITNRPGQGATVEMKIPLTLAIIPALTITSGGDRYAIPQVSLLELVRVDAEHAEHGIEQFHGAPVYRLRGNLLPLVDLNALLRVEAPPRDNADVNIVVLQADDRSFGLIVDDIHDAEEIVVKPLQKQLKGIGTFAGATIMGDGRVALILDVLGVAQRANVVSKVRARAVQEEAKIEPSPAAECQSILLFATSDGSRMAMPADLVARLEEFPRSSIERVGPQEVVQYRDEILPLLDVARVLRRLQREAGVRSMTRTRAPVAESDKVPVVVYASAGRRIGLIVGEIIDIVEETLVARSRPHRPGVQFTAVIQERVTEFLDIERIISEVDPEFFSSQAIGAKDTEAKGLPVATAR